MLTIVSTKYRAKTMFQHEVPQDHMITIVITLPTTPNAQKVGMITDVMKTLSWSTAGLATDGGGRLVLTAAAVELGSASLKSSEKMLRRSEHAGALLLSAMYGILAAQSPARTRRQLTYLYNVTIYTVNSSDNLIKKGRALVIAPQVDTATTEALRYMARTKQRRTYLPSRSRYSFTDPEKMEGWVSPGPGDGEEQQKMMMIRGGSRNLPWGRRPLPFSSACSPLEVGPP